MPIGNTAVIFIDGSNLFYSLQAEGILPKREVDFIQFTNFLCREHNLNLLRTYYYNVYVDQNDPRATFYYYLSSIPLFDVRTIESRQNREKGIDVMLATDLLWGAWSNLYDTAILVSGDADFAYAVRKVKNAGKRVIVAQFGTAMSSVLKEASDITTILTTELLEENEIILTRSEGVSSK